ncbi:MAG: hypothetical protein OHK0024_22310 [Thalassobaculales bacterium]
MATVKELGAAIAQRKVKPRVMFLGFDLWLDVYATGRVGATPWRKGGQPATGKEDKLTVVVPLPTVDGIVVSLDPTLPPDGFRLAP